jgi:hypothetical protein
MSSEEERLGLGDDLIFVQRLASLGVTGVEEQLEEIVMLARLVPSLPGIVRTRLGASDCLAGA